MIQFQNPLRILIRCSLFLILAVSFTSCARKIAFENSAVVAGAEGRVKLKIDKNKNYNINIFVRHLVPSRKLDPPKDNYVVWAETEHNGIQNIGQITSSAPLLSKTLKASLKAVSPYKPTRIFISAEDNGNVPFPGYLTVLTTRGF